MSTDIRTSILKKFRNRQTVRYSDLFQLYKTIRPEAHFPSQKEEWKGIVEELRTIKGFETLSIDNVVPTLIERIRETLEDGKEILSILKEGAKQVAETITEVKEDIKQVIDENKQTGEGVGSDAGESRPTNEGETGDNQDTLKPQPKRKRKKAKEDESE